MSDRLFIEIHAVQTMPPSNVNRDDTGSPKTAQFGGVTRARVSSQSWKKAIRDYFSEYGNDRKKELLGVRSLRIANAIAEEIVKLSSSLSMDEAKKMAENVLSDIGLKFKEEKTKDKESKDKTKAKDKDKAEKDKMLDALFFISQRQIEELANACIQNVRDKKELQNLLRNQPSIDIALFGRMVAADATLNNDASCQVAHSISTHAVNTEFDFFTALDDLSPEDNAGAGMLGTIEFNSSTLYRYANIAVHELLHQLHSKEDAIFGMRSFLEAFIKSVPTGKINTFANQSVPDAVMITLRMDRPVTLVGAFEKAVSQKEGYVKGSIQRLEKEYTRVMKYAEAPVFTSTLGMETMEGGKFERENLNAMLDEFEKVLGELI